MVARDTGPPIAKSSAFRIAPPPMHSLYSTLPSSAAMASAHRSSRPAVFVDKDGTLTENVSHNADPALQRFMPGAAESLAALQRAGFALVVVSNQSGLARGHFSLAQFMALCDALREQLRSHGVVLTDLLFCPHAPGADGRPVCICRKPGPWMLRQAASMHELDLAQSWMVGDTLDDVEAGHRAGCRSVLYDAGGETERNDSALRHPELQETDWDAIAHHIVAQRGLAGAGACA
jgi:D-glycero-D-manno-heptose 1,7-bisphosphate phosphatase